MPKKKIKKSSDKSNNNIIFAFLATFLSIIGFIIALIAKRRDKYVMFYAKQSLIVFIASVIAGILAKTSLIFPIMGNIINLALNIIIFILWLLSWIYALSGEMKEVPIIGYLARSFKF